MDWVTLEKFWSVEEAQLALGFLETEEIPCRLEGVAMAGNFWHLSNATGGVSLLVAPEDAERAAALLTAVQHHPDTDAASDPESKADARVVEPDSAEAEDQVDRNSVPTSDDWDNDDDDEDRPGLFDRLRKQKTLIIGSLLFPMFIGVLLGAFGMIMMLVLSIFR